MASGLPPTWLHHRGLNQRSFHRTRRQPSPTALTHTHTHNKTMGQHAHLVALNQVGEKVVWRGPRPHRPCVPCLHLQPVRRQRCRSGCVRGRGALVRRGTDRKEGNAWWVLVVLKSSERVDVYWLATTTNAKAKEKQTLEARSLRFVLLIGRNRLRKLNTQRRNERDRH